MGRLLDSMEEKPGLAKMYLVHFNADSPHNLYVHFCTKYHTLRFGHVGLLCKAQLGFWSVT